MDYCITKDEMLGILVPIVVYWVYSGFYMMLGSLEKYRLHPMKEEDAKNLVSKRDVVIVVLFQQLVQALVAYFIFMLSRSECTTASIVEDTSFLILAKQFFVAMFVVDTWQYFWHRYMHLNKFLYRHIHSWHHRLVVPYAFGSQYNHPIEGLLNDTVGGALAFVISAMSPRTSIYFFSFATIKGIDDHCGLSIPFNIFHMFFWNNTAYHDVHHQLYGSKYNFSQPFFITWDKILGTYMPYKLDKRDGGGLQARPLKLKNSSLSFYHF